MQKDFHHAVVYVLCRIAGMKSIYARIVAYSSQQVDDATHGHALKFINGGIFRQTMTAHRKLSIKNFNVNNALEVWLPFHFLPQGGADTNRSLITAPNTEVLDLLLNDINNSSQSPLALYRLGIGLHVFADTFSHQDFMGYYNKHNLVRLNQRRAARIKKGIREFLYINIFRVPPIGHGSALEYPDLPYLEWYYERNNKSITVDNLEERFLPAIRSIYEYLIKYIELNPRYRSSVKIKNLQECEEKIIFLFNTRDSSGDNRHENWLKMIKNNHFEFEDFDEIDSSLSYDPREWFYEAVEAKKETSIISRIENRVSNSYVFYRKEGFSNSHWVKFMRAAAEHKYRVIHEILPALNIYVG